MCCNNTGAPSGTGSRGVDRLRFDFNILDVTPFGRQEAWEDTPRGRPQTPTMAWLRRHDEYVTASDASASR